MLCSAIRANELSEIGELNSIEREIDIAISSGYIYIVRLINFSNTEKQLLDLGYSIEPIIINGKLAYHKISWQQIKS